MVKKRFETAKCTNSCCLLIFPSKSNNISLAHKTSTWGIHSYLVPRPTLGPPINTSLYDIFLHVHDSIFLLGHLPPSSASSRIVLHESARVIVRSQDCSKYVHSTRRSRAPLERGVGYVRKFIRTRCGWRPTCA